MSGFSLCRRMLKFEHNQSDLSSNIPTKFDKNPTHSNGDISRKSGTDRHTDRQIKLGGATVYQTVTTRLLGRRSHSLSVSQHTQFLKNNMIAENDFL